MCVTKYGTNHPQLQQYTHVTCVSHLQHISAVATYTCAHARAHACTRTRSLYTRSFTHAYFCAYVRTVAAVHTFISVVSHMCTN